MGGGYPCCCGTTVPGKVCVACPDNNAPPYVTWTISGWTQPLGLGPNLNGDWVLPYDSCNIFNVDTGLNCGAVDIWRPSVHYRATFVISSVSYTFGFFFGGNGSTSTSTTYYGNILGGPFSPVLEFCGVLGEIKCRDVTDHSATATHYFSDTTPTILVNSP